MVQPLVSLAEARHGFSCAACGHVPIELELVAPETPAPELLPPDLRADLEFVPDPVASIVRRSGFYR
jgi:hypothetical protein